MGSVIFLSIFSTSSICNGISFKYASYKPCSSTLRYFISSGEISGGASGKTPKVPRAPRISYPSLGGNTDSGPSLNSSDNISEKLLLILDRAADEPMFGK